VEHKYFEGPNQALHELENLDKWEEMKQHSKYIQRHNIVKGQGTSTQSE